MCKKKFKHKRREGAVGEEQSWTEPLRGVACCAYRHLRKGEVSLELGEQVEILDVFGGFSHVRKENGELGTVPSYFLELVDIPGDTLAEQISYRRMWHAVVDEVIPADYSVCPLTTVNTIRNDVSIIPDGRPVFVVPLSDVKVCEGDTVVLRPEITSASSFTVIWRGPAVQAGRAEVKSTGNTTCLTIKHVAALDYGPYSVIAKNACGIASSVAVVKVVTRPDAPTSFVCQRVGMNALLLHWAAGFKNGMYYGIEFKSEEMEQFRCAASGLRSTTVSLRHFRPVRYIIRVFCYNLGFRSLPSEEVEVDFGKDFSLLENASELSNSIQLGEVCGRGRFSVVYEATLLKTQKSVVVKKLPADASKEDVEREVAVLSILHHSNMPRLKGVFTSEGHYFIAMKRMPGETISSYVDEFVQIHDETGQLERLLRHLSIDVLNALSYLHNRGIVHLDVKPSNLLVSDHVSLVDFGCARFLDAKEDLQWGDGDKSYSAPERIAGKPPSTASDVWSFGAVLFELCFGIAPHRMQTTLTTNSEQRSPALLSFLNEVLALEASRRPSADDCLQKDWFKDTSFLQVPNKRLGLQSRSVSFEG